MSLLRIYFILAGVLCSASSVFAAEYSLFSDSGRANNNYNNILPVLQKDDVLVFSKGERFTVSEILGHGNTTLILAGSFDGADSRLALRIPLFQGYFNAIRQIDFEERQLLLGLADATSLKSLKTQDGLLKTKSSQTYADYLNSMIDTQREFEKLEAPVLPILNVSRGEYVAVPIIKLDSKTGRSLSLEEFIADRLMREAYPEAYNALSELARKMAKVGNFADFGLRQFSYDFSTKKWILADWLGSPSKTKGFGVFSSRGHPLIAEIRVYDKELSLELQKVMDAEKALLRGDAKSCTQNIKMFVLGM